MESLIETIRTAVAPDATAETRAAGAHACRTILAALDAKPGEPMAAAVAPQPLQIATIVSALRDMPTDQLLDLAIARLRTMLPAGTDVAPVKPISFHFVAKPGAKP